MLQRTLGRDVRLISAGHAIAATAQRVLAERGLETENRGEGSYSFLCTEDPEAFRELGTRFLQMPVGEVELVELP
jgi:glutamate racemase